MSGDSDKKNIIQSALEQFREATGLPAALLPNSGTNSGRDDSVYIKLAGTRYRVATVSHLSHANLGILMLGMSSADEDPIVITKYVFPRIADRLKAANINYFDTVGNMNLKTQALFVHVKGNKLIEKSPLQREGRAFLPSGMRIIYALLIMPGLVNKTYRVIATRTGISMGTINWVLGDLKQQGFIHKGGRNGRRLIRKEELFKKWVSIYPDKLRKKQLIGKYVTSHSIESFMDNNNMKDGILWGGEIAGEILTGQLKPECFTIYSNTPHKDFIVKNKLREDDLGNIELLSPFWEGPKIYDNMSIVHPLLVYADLVGTGEERNLVIARNIFDEFLVPYLK